MARPDLRFATLVLIASVSFLLIASACTRAPQNETTPEHREEMSGPGEGEGSAGGAAPSGSLVCPAQEDGPAEIPNVSPEQRTLDYWLARAAEQGDLDEALLTPEQVHDHDLAMAEVLTDLGAPIDVEDLRTKIAERATWLEEKFVAKEFVTGDGARVPAQARAELKADLLPATLSPTLRIALAPVWFRCAPMELGYYTPSLDLRFDRNSCSTAHPQELVQVVAKWPNGMLLARTRYTYGWIPGNAALSAPLSETDARAWLEGPHATIVGEQTVRSDDAHTATLPDGAIVPLLGEPARVRFATAEGVFAGTLPAGAFVATARALTRRAVFTEAFRYLDTPYSWGGMSAGRDCSRFLMDIFAAFGLYLPRHSATMAEAGTFSVDISGVTSEKERLLLIDTAAKRGIVLLQFPGHIMLYLGRDEGGRPMAIHAFAEYLVPCAKTDPAQPEAVETLFKVDRVTVSDLELGRGSSRTAFIERITKLVVLGHGPGMELDGIAQLRPSAPPGEPDTCRDSDEFAIFHSPRLPNTDQPLRVIVTASEHPGPGALVLHGPSGLVVPTAKRFGGPPFAWVATIENPEKGRYKAVFGDGTRTNACIGFTVRAGRPKASEGEASPDVWASRNDWGRGMENLYSTWVESLLDYPPDEDVTWTNMHNLVQDPNRNILFDHLSRDEDNQLSLQPDCADLPYLLRAYFAWKAGLPYGYRRCDRGKAGRAPRCDEVLTNVTPREKIDDVDSFEFFANRRVRNGVHSASGRTHPDDDETDFYPVELTRRDVQAGTLFADPYGHLLVVADWVPQGLDHYGVLLAVDAQPDGTVGRRRFWRGSFLFTPETTDVGAGFKAFRPLLLDRRTHEVQVMTNEQLANQDTFARYSRQQYEGSADDFYLTVEGLINPRPLDAVAMQLSLVDALEEAAARRIVSINNGEEYLASTGFKTVEMPSGYAIFETKGAWEDYSTPSRDMRLLISIDTVIGFPDVMRQAPERFGLQPGAELDAAVAHVQATLEAELVRRTFTYTRSDGGAHTLTLADLVERRQRLEMAYHPNDCIELRWGAAPDSDEMATCKRRAPAEHRRLMENYRSWFANRRRPPR